MGVSSARGTSPRRRQLFVNQGEIGVYACVRVCVGRGGEGSVHVRVDGWDGGRGGGVVCVGVHAGVNVVGVDVGVGGGVWVLCTSVCMQVRKWWVGVGGRVCVNGMGWGWRWG